MRVSGAYGIKLVTAPSTEPVSLVDAKAYLRLDSADTSQDSTISALIAAARKHVETYTGLALITQTWELTLDRFPAPKHFRDEWWDGVREGALSQITGAYGFIEVPKPPFQSVISITTYDMSESANAFDLSQINTDVDSKPGRIFLKVGSVWPVALRPYAAVQIQFKAGYSDDTSLVPPDLIHAVKILIGHYYENREAITDGRGFETPLLIRAILDGHRVKYL